MFPNPIFQHIFSYLSIPDRLRASRVSREWYIHCLNPYLYQHIEFKNLEFNILVKAMEHVNTINTYVRSLRFEGCYSDFVQKTIIPLPFATQTDCPFVFRSAIRSLEAPRRRQEYQRLGFELHQKFTKHFGQLLRRHQQTLRTLCIVKCDLDLEMTDHFEVIIKFGKLERFEYNENHDNGIKNTKLLKRIIEGNPDMKEFLGRHIGLNDEILKEIIYNWQSIETLTITGSSKTITKQILIKLLKQCKTLKRIDLIDLYCFSDLGSWPKLNTSIIDLRLTKYISPPLSSIGCQILIEELFPNLKRFEYFTNFLAFQNQIEGMTQNRFKIEREIVTQIMKTKKSLTYFDHWEEPITMEQRLIALTPQI